MIASSFVCLLLLVLAFQSPRDTVRQHYETAEAQRRAGNLAAAETEYAAILAEGYVKLGKVYSAQKEYKNAITALEAASVYRPDAEDVLVDLAIAYFNSEQFDKALVPLNKARLGNPQNAGAHHMMGKSYFMLGELRKSAEELRAALKLKPNDYDVSYTLGLVYLKQRQFDAAKQIYDRMLAQLGDRPELRIVFGRAYRETGFLAEAIEEFKRAVGLDDHFPRVHYYLGLTYLLKDGVSKLDDAAEEFKVELASHPDEFFANYYLGIIYAIQRKWELAIPLLEKASESQPKNPDPYFYLGEGYQAVGKHDKAVEVLRKAIIFNPSLDHNEYQVSSAHYRLAQSLLRTGHTEEGRKELQVALDLKMEGHKRDEEKTTTYLNSANLHEQNGNFPEILSVEGTVAESDPLDHKTATDLKNSEAYYSKLIASAHNNIGLLRAERQDFPAAAEQFAQAARWDPQLTEISFNWGLACYKAELYKQAIPPLETELKMNPGNVSAKQLLGMSYFMTDGYSRASELLSDVISVRRNDATVYYTLAVSLIKEGKQDSANRVIQQMVAMSSSTPQLHILLGQAYYEQGDTNKSLEELAAALALDRKTRLAHYYTGLVYLKAGKFDSAAQEFESELALNPSDVQAKYHLAFVLLASQKTERGIKLMREIVQLKPDYANGHYELGKALLQQGDIEGAVKSLEAAAKLKPGESYVHYQLGRAYLRAGRNAEGESHIEMSKQLKDKARSQTSQ
jgi:tetratricopeptide (TPR) repeat protein